VCTDYTQNTQVHNFAAECAAGGASDALGLVFFLFASNLSMTTWVCMQNSRSLLEATGLELLAWHNHRCIVQYRFVDDLPAPL